MCAERFARQLRRGAEQSSACSLLALTIGCAAPPETSGHPAHSGAVASVAAPEPEVAQQQCRAVLRALRATPEAPGSPLNKTVRSATLGRARGEPVVWLSEPQHTPSAQLPEAWVLAQRAASPKASARSRLQRLLRQFPREKKWLRMALLREGYVYAPEPIEALALTTELKLERLFDEAELVLTRGAQRWRILEQGQGRERHYVYGDGPLAEQRAELLFGDRVGLPTDAPSAPRHLDFSGLQREHSVDRVRILRLTARGSIAELRFGRRWVTAALKHSPQGVGVQLDCIDLPAADLKQVHDWSASLAARRAGLLNLHSAVDGMLHDQLRFDRPQGEKGPDRDGQLRPSWLAAYRFGQGYFRVDETSYSVFNAAGDPTPPQVCVDFVLESFERAAGTWFRPRGDQPAREVGRLDFNAWGITNRRGVLALEDFALAHPEVFSVTRIEQSARVPFAQREKFFSYLESHADDFAVGDVLAIRGVKADGRVHQHAILLERVDPLSGFPYGLADQMSRPRRRTWEGVMAEAPRRSLYFRLRLQPDVLARLAAPSQ